ncbi:hypothetical protein [Mycolicibacterium hodleri]|uniref:Uncharacterized protein n=1 Tax=Mycolicibacterium hodleri TaxID=49897 RepID=A0A502E0C2_9MYCO|nr:hypothetical protein [Mycolicibacterium hodleri]TPG29860.1 hypothetical protein EAH80_25550 [Mycolicibacterium hodleri]
MSGPDRLVYYLRGTPQGFDGAPDAIEIPRLYETESEARAELSVVMTLSRMVHGDTIANSASWYLQTADVSSAPALGEEAVFHGYLLGETVYPLAGGWDELLDAFDWEPFVCEIERGRAHRARLPWRRDMLGQFSIETCRPTCAIDYSFFRFTPVSSELLVRPLDVYVTEPLF